MKDITHPYGQLAQRLLQKLSLSMLCLICLFGLSACVTMQEKSGYAEPPERIDVSEIKSLNLDEAVKIALANNPQLRAKHRTIDVKAWEKLQASLPENLKLSYSFDPGEWAIELTGVLSSLVDLGGQRQRKVDIAQYQEDLAVTDLFKLKIQIAHEVRATYASLLGVNKKLDLLDKKAEAYASLLEAIQKQYDLGKSTQLDVLEAQHMQNQLKIIQRQTSHKKQLVLSELNTLLALNLNNKIKVDANYEIASLPDVKEEGDGYELGKVNRPEINAMVIKTKEQGIRLAYAELSWLPDLELGPVISGDEEETKVGATFSIELPIFDQGQALRGKANAYVKQLADELLAVEAEVLLEIRQSLQTLKYQEQLLEVGYPKLMKNLEQRKKLLDRGFKDGTIGQVDVIKGEIELIDMAIKLNKSETDFRKSQSDLAAALGIID